MLVLPGDVEILGLALSMVSGDEVTYDTWQVVSLCHLLTFGDMADYHRGTFHFSEACVRIDTFPAFPVSAARSKN